MDKRSILLAVADPQALVDITQALGTEWEATSAACEADALGHLNNRPFDALLVDFNVGSPDASELLNQALEKRPETVRFLLAYEADLALVAAKVAGTPNILPKPVEPESLKGRIENGVADSSSEPGENSSADASTASPTIPPVYSEVLKALESPGVSYEQVGAIISKDDALTAEVFRLTNSSYLGLPRDLTDPVEAVESLGLDAVKTLVMALQFLAEHSRLRPAYLSFEGIWLHSINVAQIARDLVLFETKDRALASQALAAGLVHDLGKVVLVTNFDDLYGRVHSLARKQPVALWNVEKEMFGANHGEIGACLVGMWNLPGVIVDAAALHHEPLLGEKQQLTPLAAVHIANVLEHQLRPTDDDMMVAPIISTPFLNELGLLQRLPVWRAAFANRRVPEVEPEFEPVAEDFSESTVLSSTSASRTANHLPGPAAATRTTTSGHAEDGTPSIHGAFFRGGWVYAGIAAVFLFLLALWFRTQPALDETQPVYARIPAPNQTPPASPMPAPETAPDPVQQTASAVAVSEPSQSPSTPAPAVSEPVVSPPAPEPVTAKAPAAVVTNVPAPTVAPQEFRVNAIIYTSVRPSAMVNGATVNVGDAINGATIVAIGRTTVTLQINGQRKTYGLR